MTNERFLPAHVADLRCDICGEPMYSAEDLANADLVDSVVAQKNEGNTSNMCRHCMTEIWNVIRNAPKVVIPLPPEDQPPKRKRKKR